MEGAGFDGTRMVRLATVAHTFHARVIAARVGAEGIPTELRGCVDGPYPMGDVHVYVPEIDLPIAQELLMADEVESAFEVDDYDDDEAPPRELVMILGVVLLLAVLLFMRQF